MKDSKRGRNHNQKERWINKLTGKSIEYTGNNDIGVKYINMQNRTELFC